MALASIGLKASRNIKTLSMCYNDRQVKGGTRTTLTEKSKDNLLIFTIEGFSYGILEAHINELVSGAEKLHKLPFFPKRVAGIATVEIKGGDSSKKSSKNNKKTGSKVGTFFDLGYCLGHKKDTFTTGGYLFTIGSKSIKDPIEGFATTRPPEIIEVNKKEILEMPKAMLSTELLGCLSTAKGLIPVLDISSLYKDIKGKNWALPTFDISVDNLKGSEISSLRIVDLPASDEESLEYLLNGSLLDKDDIKLESTCNVKFAPPHIECFALAGGNLMVVLNIGVLAGTKKVDLSSGTVLGVSKAGIGLLVESDRGISKAQLKENLPLATTALISKVIIKDKEIVPLLNFNELLSVNSRAVKEKFLYRNKKSDFAESFGSDEVGLLEFTIRGLRHAIPKEEEGDSFPLKKPRPLEGLPDIFLGVVEHKGDILPVLDPAQCFGVKTETPFEKMVLIKKDGFRVFIVTEGKPKAITVEAVNQKQLPLSMDKEYVYGCYVEDDSVGLVLNMEALLLDYDEDEFKEFFGTVASELDLEVSEETTAGDAPLEASSVESVSSEIDSDKDVEKETVVASVEELSDKLKIDSSVFAGKSKTEEEFGKSPTEAEENLDEKPDIKEEFKKYEESLKDQEPEDGDHKTAQFIEYRGDVKTEKSEDGSIEEKKEEKPEKDVHQFKSPIVAPDVAQASNSAPEDNRRLALLVVGLVIVVVMLAVIFLSGRGKVKEVKQRVSPVVTQDRVVVNSLKVEPKVEKVVEEAASSNHQLLIEIDSVKEEVNIVKLKKGAPKPEGATIYVVLEGDTLWHIARQLTGNPFDYPKLAKSSAIENPDLIYPNQKIYVKLIKG